MVDTDKSYSKTWLEKLTQFLLHHPEDRTELLELLHIAVKDNLIDANALEMMEGVLNVSETQVRDVMIPRSQMDVIDISLTPEEFIPRVIETAHSRFPVIDEDKNDIIGILLAKDLLRYYSKESFNVRDMLRPVVFIPESKRLNVLLKDFQANRNHIAIVVDEYGGVSGMITIEDVLEQIVGDIQDEYDFDTQDDIVNESQGEFRIKALLPIEEFNKVFETTLDENEFSTIGGLLVHQFGHIPQKGEKIYFQNFEFTTLKADNRQLHTLLVKRLEGNNT